MKYKDACCFDLKDQVVYLPPSGQKRLCMLQNIYKHASPPEDESLVIHVLALPLYRICTAWM